MPEENMIGELQGVEGLEVNEGEKAEQNNLMAVDGEQEQRIVADGMGYTIGEGNATRQGDVMTKVEKSKMAWSVKLAWVIYVVTGLFFVAIGPVVIFLMLSLRGYAWVVSLMLFGVMSEVMVVMSPAVAVLSGLSLYKTQKKCPEKLRTVITLLVGPMTGLTLIRLVMMDVFKMSKIGFFVAMTIIAIMPAVVLAIFRSRDKQKANLGESGMSDSEVSYRSQAKIKTAYVVMMTLIVLETLLALLGILLQTVMLGRAI